MPQEVALRLAENFAATDANIAKVLGVELNTLMRWKRDYPEFCQALKDCKDAQDAKVVKCLFERATGYTYECEKVLSTGAKIRTTVTMPPDPTSMIFWLKNRQPEKWREKQELEHIGGPMVAVINEVKK